ncbi:MAG: hypothetical protein CMJ33_11200 [Phycisphaerae bacterium]|nr:hypothetical protein [Phycisphaerae bacterium]
MGMTLLSLATAMLLISRLARTGTNLPKTDAGRGWSASIWILTLTTILALLAGYAWFRESAAAPALICALTLPFMFVFSGTHRRPVRVAGMMMVTAGSSCLLGLWWMPREHTSGDQVDANGRPAPMIIFDDASRRQELLARARACEVELDIRMMQGVQIESSEEADGAALGSLMEEAQSIIRTLERTEGSTAPSALRLSRLEARLRRGGTFEE